MAFLFVGGVRFVIVGFLECKLTSASPADVITRLNKNGIRLHNIQYLDDLHIAFSVERSQYRMMKRLVSDKGDSVTISHRIGWYWSFKYLPRRPVLVFGILLLTVLMLYLPSRVLFVTVSGNEYIPTNLIIEGAENSGIYFGASRRAVRSEKVKNRLLSEIPELKWAGINTFGCVAVISVEEKTPITDKGSRIPFGNMVAVRDGVITDISVLRGTAACTVGQAVKEGQLLISGFEDLGICVKGVGAKGEVYGETNRDLTLLTPTECIKRGRITYSEKQYSLLLGKKLINFYKGSGISDRKCVRMYAYNYIYLPGGLRLPIAFVSEEIIYYDSSVNIKDTKDDFTWVEETAKNYLYSQMLAGEILNSFTSVSVKKDACILYGSFQCHEMIGRVRREEIVRDYG